MGEKLSFEGRKEHLKSNPELNKQRKTITQKHEEEIFHLLNKNYNTGFEIRKRNTYFEETYRYYYDAGFYFALKTIKQLQNKKTLQYKTIDKIITFIEEIKTTEQSLNTHKPESSPDSLLNPIIRNENGQGQLNFFPEEKKNLTQNQDSYNQSNTIKYESKPIELDTIEQKSWIDDYYDN